METNEQIRRVLSKALEEELESFLEQVSQMTEGELKQLEEQVVKSSQAIGRKLMEGVLNSRLHERRPVGEALAASEDRHVTALQAQAKQARSQPCAQRQPPKEIERLYIELDGLLARMRRGCMWHAALPRAALLGCSTSWHWMVDWSKPSRWWSWVTAHPGFGTWSPNTFQGRCRSSICTMPKNTCG